MGLVTRKILASRIQKVTMGGMSDYDPGNELTGEDSEELERERLKETLALLAATGATMEGFLTATETSLADPIKQEERERHREIAKEVNAILGGEFAELRQEIRTYLGQQGHGSDPMDDTDSP
jgi:hypothetical protein